MTCIGLFGTCGQSKWRDDFMSRYEELGIKFFNPQVGIGEWHPGLVDGENRHFAEDDIILFPVTHESTGQGSLVEIGFSIRQSLRVNCHRFFIFLIDDECNDPNADGAHRKESVNSRALIKSKLVEEEIHNVFLVDSLEEMLTLSIQLHEICVKYNEIKDVENG